MMTESMTNAEYRKAEGISSSDVKAVVNRSLFHWHNAPTRQSAAMALGTMVHDLVLEPNRNLYMRGPDDKRTKDWKDAQEQADAAGKILVKASEYDHAHAIAQAVNTYTPALMYLDGPSALIEASFFATDIATGVKIKARPDVYIPSDGTVIDLKTTKDASPRGFAREIARYGYDLQAAHYIRTLRAHGEEARHFVFIAVETEPPHAIGIHMLTGGYIKSADAYVTDALLAIERAKATGDYKTGWPAVNVVDIPPWRRDDPPATDLDF